MHDLPWHTYTHTASKHTLFALYLLCILHFFLCNLYLTQTRPCIHARDCIDSTWQLRSQRSSTEGSCTREMVVSRSFYVPIFRINPATWLHSVYEIRISPYLPVTPVQLMRPGTYWPKCILLNGWLYITSRPIFYDNVVCWLLVNIYRFLPIACATGLDPNWPGVAWGLAIFRRQIAHPCTKFKARKAFVVPYGVLCG